MMWIAMGSYLKKLRTDAGLTQQALASLLGIDRSVLARWEGAEKPVPQDRIGALAAALRVSPDSLIKAWTPGRDRQENPEIHPHFRIKRLPRYPVKGTFEEMLALSPDLIDIYRRAREMGLTAVGDYEMRYAFPRDSALELAVAYQLLAGGASLAWRTPLELGCRGLVVIRDTVKYAGDMLRHVLILRRPEALLVLIPQCSLIVVSQSRERRCDFLTLVRTPGRSSWDDTEIDGGFHQETANDDARRSHGLRLLRIGYDIFQVMASDFVDRFVRDALRNHERCRRRQ